MNRIHSKILALVLSVFLIQAADPPVDKTQAAIEVEAAPKEIATDKDESASYEAIARFLHRERKTDYEKLLEKDFIRPLLKLYERQIHREPHYLIGNSTASPRISKEDYVEDFNILSKEEVNLLIHGGETYQHNLNQNVDQQISRRDDSVAGDEDEHIGEILPPPKVHRFGPTRRFYQPPRVRTRKSYDIAKPYRKPVTFPGERYRPEYEPSAFSSEGFEPDSTYYRPEAFDAADEARNSFGRPTRIGPLPTEGSFRLPRRLRHPEGFAPSAREPFWPTPWASARRPRVIFPSDLVSFREPSGNQEEPDWLAGDNNLQDIQEQDTRDRGTQLGCASGVTCEFFLSCWLSGGQLESSCDGLLRGCCQRSASKTGQSAPLAVGTLEAPPESPKSVVSFDSDFRCGISTNRQQAQRRIVGGEEAGFGTFPWQAYIRIGSSRCGGSLVSRRHVVTAGHCVARATPRQVHVTLGDYVINSAVEPLPAYTFGVSQIQVHPFFKFTPQADRFDVAVLRLDRAAHSLPHITPICLPPRGEGFLGEVGVAAGWGALSPGSRLRPQTLQAVQVPVIDSRACERWHRSKGIAVTIYDEMMCAGYKNGGRDSCQGDSGGPLMLQKQGRWFLIGIVSAGYSCAQPGQPGIYHRVAHTVDWITRTIGA